MLKKICLLLLGLLPVLLNATDFKPWYPRNLELQPQATYSYQSYQTVDTVHGFAHRPAYNDFLDLSLSGAYSQYAIELETLLAATRHRSFGFADLRFTGRYQWLDDVIGDPCTLTTGLTLTQVFSQSRHDNSFFYHGGIEVEAHVAAGRELSCREFWQSRYWGVLGFGVADEGSPWVRANLSWEHNWWDTMSATVFLESLWGFGGEGLHLNKHFHGYGPIHHQSIDLGFRYSYTLECGGVATCGYARRFYALNCPRCVSEWCVSFLYPFGL